MLVLVKVKYDDLTVYSDLKQVSLHCDEVRIFVAFLFYTHKVITRATLDRELRGAGQVSKARVFAVKLVFHHYTQVNYPRLTSCRR